MESDLAATVIVASAIATIFSTIAVLTIIWWILGVIADWKIFKKAGEPGWKSLIPIYNYYILFKITKMRNWFWWIVGSMICALVMYAFDGSWPILMSEEQLAVYQWGDHPMALFATVMIIIVTLYTSIVNSYRLSKVFGHGIGFTLGLIFFQPIFMLILGFGSSTYDKKRLRRH